jgi:predicted Zn-dependent protease
MPRIGFSLVLTLLIAGATLATFGYPDPPVSLASVAELWTDALRDTDQIGMHLTRVSDAEEMRIGSDLARAPETFGTEDPAATVYLTGVAQSLLPHVQRPGIRYQFHVIDTPGVNAFALPGGQIFVLRGMLEFTDSEAELATVLGHEISHVDLRHCIERYQYQTKLRQAGAPELGAVVELAHRLATFEFSPYQELEADAEGQRLAAEAGYDPAAAAALFRRMQQKFHETSQANANTPAGELAQSVSQAIGSYFQTHPPSEERAQRLDEMAAIHRRDVSVYVGKQNLRYRMPKSRREYPDEWRKQ